MEVTKIRCIYCGSWFNPCPTVKIQKVCSQSACQIERHRRGCLEWHKKHPEYDQSRRHKIRAWAKKNDYWKEYRLKHPQYRKHEAARMRARRLKLGCVAKRDALRQIAVEKLVTIQAIRPENVAKRDVYDRRVDKVLEFLIWNEGVAKRDSLAINVAPAL